MSRESLISRAEEVAAAERQRLQELKARFSTDAELREQQKENIRNKYRGVVERKLTGDTGLAKEVADEGVTLEELALMVVNAVLADEAPKTDKATTPDVKGGTETLASPEPVKSTEAPIVYESLTQAEIDSLPERVRAELQAYLDLHNLLVGYDGSDPDELDAFKELIEEGFNSVPKVETIKFVVRLRSVLGGLGGIDKTKLINFINGVTDKAKAILKVPVKPVSGAATVPTVAAGTTTGVATPERGKSDWPELKVSHPDKDNYATAIVGNFATICKERGTKFGAQYLSYIAETFSKEFQDSNGGLSNGMKMLGLYNVLKQFTLKYEEKTFDWAKTNFDIFTLVGSGREGDFKTEAEAKSAAEQLKSKAGVLGGIVFVEEMSIKMSNRISMTSDWEKIVQLDRENEDFNIGTLDRLMHPKEKYAYEYAPIMEWMMWMGPQFVREFGNYNDKHSGIKGEFDAWLLARLKEELEKAVDPKKADLAFAPYDYIESRVAGRQQKRFEVDKQLAKKLLDSANGNGSSEFLIFHKLASSLYNGLGLRQHTFRIDLARGLTPAEGLNQHRRWMTAVCPYALNNYNCYKELTPHLSAEGFDMILGSPISGPDDDLTIDEKIFNINVSIAKTLELLESVQRPVRPRIKLGDTRAEIAVGVSNPDFGIDNIYPDLYSFVVRNYEERRLITREEIAKKKKEEGIDIKANKSASDFSSWLTGLQAIESFVEMAVAPPLGTFDRARIAEFSAKDARTKMLDVLAKLVQKIVSPLKANQDWVRWDHVGQFLLMYIDKMYRTYRLIDDTDGGLALFTRQIREQIYSGMANLGGVGSDADPNMLEAIKISGGKGKGEELASPTNAKPSVRDMLAGTSASAAHISDDSLRKIEGQAKMKKSYDLRDYILNRIPRTTGYAFSDKTIFLQYAVVEERRGASGGRARATTNSRVDALIVNPVRAYNIERSKFFHKNKVEKFYKGCEAILFGTPTEEQKKTAEEKK